MAVSRLKLANTLKNALDQPLVRLENHKYQRAFMVARQLRVCSNGHHWSLTPTCPSCGRVGGRAYSSLLLRAGRRGGKALDVRTLIPTPDGWRTMGDLEVGDRVFDETGHPTRITYTSPIYLGHECYRVEFSDHQSLVADADHQWVTYAKEARKGRRGPAVVTTREIAASLHVGSGESNHAVQIAGALVYPNVALPVQPYTLGAWLGDGSSRAAEICCTETEILSFIVQDGYTIHPHKKGANKTTIYGIGSGEPRTRDRATGRMVSNSSLHSTLRAIGLLGNKHIPELYFSSAISQRLALVQGLMDTDGQVNSDGTCEFDSTSHVLAYGFWRLVTTLGVSAQLRTGTAKLYGREIGPKFRVTFPPVIDAARLPRKLVRIQRGRPRTRSGKYRFVKDVVPVASVAVKCIQVASRSEMYLAGEACIPTHNTRIGALAAIDELAPKHIRGWCCAPTYPKLNDYVLPAFFQQIPQVWLDHPKTTWSESELTLTLPHKSMVQFRSLEDADRGRGPGLDFLWIDEICELSLKHWETISPALADRAGVFFGTTSPKGEDWVHDSFYVPAEMGEPGFWACAFTTLDNPLMQHGPQRAYVERQRLSMTDLMFRQEYLAEIVTFTGAIYGELVGRATIEGTDDQLREYFPEWPRLDVTRPSVSGIDPGTDHPFAGVHVVASPRGLVVVGEYEERSAFYATHATHIQAMRRGFTGRVGIDRSQAQAQIELSQYGLFTVPAENAVVAGINRVSAWMLKNQPGKMPSGLVLPRTLCPRLIKRLQSYRWAENEKDDGETKQRELVYKKGDDLPDALRYALMTYPALPQVDPAPMPGRPRDLAGLPDNVRVEIERERRSRQQTVDDEMEMDEPTLVVEGMGDFNS